MIEKEDLFQDDPLWYKDAVIYELHIKAFFDSNDDGIGDFRGLARKLDYIEDLGVTAIWLLPFYPSPLRDDGYDISDYLSINSDYGVLRDFKDFLREAKKRNIKVITELVLNHTSDQHAWFKKSRKAKPDSVWRNFYVWSDTPEKYLDARIIFKDFEMSNWTWDHGVKSHYWHRFYSHQPDLNFDNPHVHKALFRAIDFWFRTGVDGLRLDAIPYLYEREGTNCENLPETYTFLKKLREYIDAKFRNRMLLAEANQWPEDAAAYFGNGDMCHMAFHFPLMPRMFMSVQMEDRFPIIDILEQTPPLNETCQWAMFLRNHDELTLEMVTDEERDYMYRVYAKDPRAKINLGIRRRLAPLLDNNRRKIELMNVLLFTMPGTPVIYYGDEIGMGDNYYLGDRDGVRTPMQWSPDRNAGFSLANPHKLYLPVIIDPEYHYEALNVETQERNPSSLLWWMKRLIAMRKRFKAFGRGSLEFLLPDNSKVLAFIRRCEEELILVVVNLSRFSQVVELDLSSYAGFVPEDVMSQNRFPHIKELPYMLSLGPHGYYLFQLQRVTEDVGIPREESIPELSVRKNWVTVLTGKQKEKLVKDILPGYIKSCRWFGGKARVIRKIDISDVIPVVQNSVTSCLTFLEIKYTEGMHERYLLPLSFAPIERMKEFMHECPHCIIARLRVENVEGILLDSVYDEGFRQNLLSMITRRKNIRMRQNELRAYPGKAIKSLIQDRGIPVVSHVMKAEQSNTSIVYENVFILKLYRRLEEGINPDLEISRFLTERQRFSHSAPFGGAIEFRKKGVEPLIVAQLQGHVNNEGDAWTYTLDALGQYFEQVLSRKGELKEVPEISETLVDTGSSQQAAPCFKDICMIPHYLLDIDDLHIPSLFHELSGSFYLEMVALLGQRTGELHSALSSNHEDADFSPEPFSLLYQRSLYQSMRSQVRRVFHVLQTNIKNMQQSVAEEAAEILDHEKHVLDHFRKIIAHKISATKIRIHGDYHLGQVLFTGKDFVIIDFEGEPARSLSERKLRRSPLRDVAGMIRSFHYAVHSTFMQYASLRPENVPLLEPWVEPWFSYVSGIFTRSYLHSVAGARFIPRKHEEFQTLLEIFLLDKAIYELGYELNNRPDWVIIPIRGIQYILKKISKT